MEQETLCWSCRNAYAHRCGWMQNCQPVEGWSAQSTDAVRGAMLVTSCPNYIQEKRRKRSDKLRCPICGKRYFPSKLNQEYCSDLCRELAGLIVS